MRLRSYTAENMAKAMDIVRRELGDDAVIVSSQTDPDQGTVQVTAARDEPDTGIESFADGFVPGAGDGDPGAISAALHYHRTPAWVVDKLVDGAWESGRDDPVQALAAALDALYNFEPLAHRKGERPIMLVGAPGAGKTVTAAKLAARARLERKPIEVYSADMMRAGSLEQLRAFTRILEMDLHPCDGAKELARLVAVRAEGARAVIDTAGTNPFDGVELASLAALVEAARAEPVLVLAAGGDPFETDDVIAAFREIGVVRVIATRLDITRRYGSLLGAAVPPMRLSEVSVTPHIANGLSPVNPVSFARLLLRSAGAVETTPVSTEA